MSKPIYYFDTTRADYTIVKKGVPPESHIFEFQATPLELVTLKKRGCLLSTKTGRTRFSVVKAVPKEPLNNDGTHLCSVVATMLVT